MSRFEYWFLKSTEISSMYLLLTANQDLKLAFVAHTRRYLGFIKSYLILILLGFYNSGKNIFYIHETFDLPLHCTCDGCQRIFLSCCIWTANNYIPLQIMINSFWLIKLRRSPHFVIFGSVGKSWNARIMNSGDTLRRLQTKLNLLTLTRGRATFWKL